MQIANIEEKNLHNFWTTWGISMKFSGKDVTCDNIKNLKKHIFGKTKGGVTLTTNPQAFLGLSMYDILVDTKR